MFRHAIIKRKYPFLFSYYITHYIILFSAVYCLLVSNCTIKNPPRIFSPSTYLNLPQSDHPFPFRTKAYIYAYMSYRTGKEYKSIDQCQRFEGDSEQSQCLNLLSYLLFQAVSPFSSLSYNPFPTT